MSERIRFNNNWFFYNGEIEKLSPQDKGPSYQEAKTERFLSGPASRGFPDVPDDYRRAFAEPGVDASKIIKTAEINERLWRLIDLPHDYIITQVAQEDGNKAWGFFNYHPAWYRKHFVIGSEDRDKRIVLYFEGVADHATVYFNGVYMYDHFEGHAPFEVDITDFIHFDEDNVLAVHVDCGTGEGWWYQGGGIYRNVWLEKDDPVSVARYGVFVHPEKKSGTEWAVPVETEVRNDRYEDVTAEVKTEICTEDGKVLAEVTGTLFVPARDKATLAQCASVTSPALWDIDDPVLHKAVTTVTVDGKITDVRENTFGFREIAFNTEGFFLNGRNVKVKGVCGHGDYGLTGLAVEESVFRYKAKLIKDMGANAYRCSHYPQAEYWMDEMDRKGIVVMDETRWFSTVPSAAKDLETLVKRDRNHPSVIMWSVGNEEPFFITEQGARISRSMYAAVKKLDPTRPILTANDKTPDVATVYEYSDIVGINYNLNIFEKVHGQFPDKPVLSTENCATGTSRGWYSDQVESLGRIPAYDHVTSEAFKSREFTWRFIYERPWIMGGMQWIAFEHRGEARWPRLCSVSGAIDLYLQKKDAFYQNQSYWQEAPMIHVLPHWNHPGKEGCPIKVYAYTNCSEAELFLNGESLGKRTLSPVDHAEWDVVYAPGVLEAVAYKDGVEVARDRQETTGEAVALKWIPENADDVKAGDILILTCAAVDAEGREVPDAAVDRILFYGNAAGAVIGTGSDHSDHVPPKENLRRMYAGRVSVAVRLGQEGTAVISAEAPGVKPAYYTHKI
ncbi:MAG: DUF4982 domain-containing protein [Lachnospiraceae bacterium]|nr:DUF4982 domain-containing protein [Lachnospiraceae bacterium]